APEVLAGQISAAITLPNGSHPMALVLRAGEIEAVLADNPFPEAADAPKTLHITFLDREVSPDLTDLAGRATGGERFVLRGRVLYLHTPDGYGRSAVAARLEAALRPARITARNFGTVTALAAMARGLA
ncbi:MAG: hypothetical protein RLZZ528_2360, partial [Pseudomonadota bacterium]